MVDFTRYRTLKQRFTRLSVGEADLVRFARTVRNAIEGYGESISIRIVTADEEETLRTNDPKFFESDDMPSTIQLVSIAYERYEVPIACKITFIAGPSGYVSLSVEGTDPRVTELFHDLRKQIESKEVSFKRLQRILDSFLFYMGLGVVVGFGVYSVFDVLLDFWIRHNPQFENSTRHYVATWVGIGAIILSFMLCPLGIVDILKKCFPSVEFSGRLSDLQTRSRKRLYWVASFILLPIVV